MIEIDGGSGAGGGQVLRTAAALSALAGEPFRIFDIRAKRPNPGIREQHLQAIRAVAEFCHAHVSNAAIGSGEIEFHPGGAREKEVSVSIGTAGSIGLVLQALFVAGARDGISVVAHGGATYGKWAAPVDYMSQILAPLLSLMGWEVKIGVSRDGFYPRGGGRVKARIKPGATSPLSILEVGEVLEVSVVSVASSSLARARVAERQAEAARERLFRRLQRDVELGVRYSDSACPGSGIVVWARTSHSVLGGSGLGEIGKRAEKVGQEAADNLLAELESGAVDSFAGDQLLPYLALAGGQYRPSSITEHCRTNAEVIERFLPVRFDFSGGVVSVSQRT